CSCLRAHVRLQQVKIGYRTIRGRSVPNFAVAKSVDAVLIVGSVAFKKRAHIASHHTPRGPRRPSASRAGIGSRCKRSRTAFASGAYRSVYEFKPPSAGLEAVRRVEGALGRNAPESVGTLSLSVENHCGATSH